MAAFPTCSCSFGVDNKKWDERWIILLGLSNHGQSSMNFIIKYHLSHNERFFNRFVQKYPLTWSVKYSFSSFNYFAIQLYNLLSNPQGLPDNNCWTTTAAVPSRNGQQRRRKTSSHSMGLHDQWTLCVSNWSTCSLWRPANGPAIVHPLHCRRDILLNLANWFALSISWSRCN